MHDSGCDIQYVSWIFDSLEAKHHISLTPVKNTVSSTSWAGLRKVLRSVQVLNMLSGCSVIIRWSFYFSTFFAFCDPETFTVHSFSLMNTIYQPGSSLKRNSGETDRISTENSREEWSLCNEEQQLDTCHQNFVCSPSDRSSVWERRARIRFMLAVTKLTSVCRCRLSAPDGSYRWKSDESTDAPLIHARTTRARLLCCCTKLWIMKICYLSSAAGYSASALKERKNLEGDLMKSCLKAPEAKCVDQTPTIFSREESFSLSMLLDVLEETVSSFRILPVEKFNWNSSLNLAFWNEESSLKCRAAVRFVSHLSFGLESSFELKLKYLWI